MYRTPALYDEWNEMKKDIHFEKNNVMYNRFLNEREIWYIKLGVNV